MVRGRCAFTGSVEQGRCQPGFRPIPGNLTVVAAAWLRVAALTQKMCPRARRGPVRHAARQWIATTGRALGLPRVADHNEAAWGARSPAPRPAPHRPCLTTCRPAHRIALLADSPFVDEQVTARRRARRRTTAVQRSARTAASEAIQMVGTRRRWHVVCKDGSKKACMRPTGLTGQTPFIAADRWRRE